MKASEILVEVLKGDVDFAQMAKTHSISASAQKGGDLGYLTDVPFAEMAAPLLALDVGEESSVFKGPDGFYIIKLEDKKGGETIPFDDIKEKIIENQTLAEQQQAILNHITNLRKGVKIEINEAYFQ